MVRGGGVYASNQYISIAICLLPFVRSRWVLLAALATILLQFSRGGYIALVLIVVLSRLRRDASSRAYALDSLVSTRALLTGLFGLVGSVALLALVAPDGFKFLLIRLIGGGAFGINLEIADALAGLPLTDLFNIATASAEGDDRGLIWKAALRIASDHHFVGVGAGNFVIAASTLNAELLYSNAHNLYLTLLAELGFASLLLYLMALAVYCYKAWRGHAPGLVALGTFAVYGMFSGQIYETSSEVSICQFIVLLFVFANIDVAGTKKGKQECQQ
jgi:O-antigen ligase